jgi:hypothetical protein
MIDSSLWIESDIIQAPIAFLAELPALQNYRTEMCLTQLQKFVTNLKESALAIWFTYLQSSKPIGMFAYY